MRESPIWTQLLAVLARAIYIYTVYSYGYTEVVQFGDNFLLRLRYSLIPALHELQFPSSTWTRIPTVSATGH